MAETVAPQTPGTSPRTAEVIAPRQQQVRFWSRWLAWAARGREGARLGALPLMALSLACVMVVAVASGPIPIPPGVTAQVLLNHLGIGHFAPSWSAIDEAIILLRLPRVCGAALVGAALAMSGVLFQGMLRNPLADPLLLGTSSGASLGATLALLVPATFVGAWFGFSILAIFAFAGALLATSLVYALAVTHGRAPVVTLLLAGVAVGAMLGALQLLLLTRIPYLGQHALSIYLWISGSIDAQSGTQVWVTTVVVVAGLLAGLALAPMLDAFALGEEMVGHLGWRVERAKLLVVVVATLLVGAAVSMSGLVGFVGLVAPHLCRLLFGPRHRLLLPASALGGAIFVVLADLLARVLIAPSELPLSVLTALVGGPFFLWLLRQAGRRYTW